MEEAGLLKERLQAITDKRRIQEDIAKKRRQIEEEKLKLQYIKKKALREQWLMDGLSQQSEEEQEAMRLQAQEEQQQSVVLRTNIDRIEKDIEALETQELNISANEEVILKRLKEVERTAEDIIKELKAEFEPDSIHLSPDSPLAFGQTPRQNVLQQEKPNKEPTAMFAMEISVEHDMRTGQSQVVATATVNAKTLQERGVKVYDDGRKSVYALHSGCPKLHTGEVGDMTPVEVDELLRQARDKKVPSEVQYHHPVYAAPYMGNSRPPTPRAPSKTTTQSPSPVQTKTDSRNGSQTPGEESQHSQELGGYTSLSRMPSPSPFQPAAMPKDGAQRQGEEPKSMQSLLILPSQAQTDNLLIPQSEPPHVAPKIPQSLTNGHTSDRTPALVSVIARSEGMPIPIQPYYRSVDSASPSACHSPGPVMESTAPSDRLSPSYEDSEASLSLVSAIPDELETKPVTMIFMGYQNAEEEEEEEEDLHAELVIIGNSDDDDDAEDKRGKKDHYGDQPLSYHPEGYKSKVFSPKVGVAKVSGRRDVIEEAYTNSAELVPHKPTFTHKQDQCMFTPRGNMQAQAASTWKM